jgi:hypothetical protein
MQRGADDESAAPLGELQGWMNSRLDHVITQGFLPVDESRGTDSLLPASQSVILEAIIDAVQGAAPSLRCFRRNEWAVFSDHDALLVIIAHADGAQLFFDEDVVCSVGDRPTWSSGAVIRDRGEETLATLRGLVRKLQLAGLERAERATSEARRG